MDGLKLGVFVGFFVRRDIWGLLVGVREGLVNGFELGEAEGLEDGVEV